MTREEAIAILQEEIDGNLELTLREWKERDERRLFPALRMAIEALQILEAAERIKTEILPQTKPTAQADDGVIKYIGENYKI